MPVMRLGPDGPRLPSPLRTAADVSSTGEERHGCPGFDLTAQPIAVLAQRLRGRALPGCDGGSDGGELGGQLTTLPFALEPDPERPSEAAAAGAIRTCSASRRSGVIGRSRRQSRAMPPKPNGMPASRRTPANRSISPEHTGSKIEG